MTAGWPSGSVWPLLSSAGEQLPRLGCHLIRVRSIVVVLVMDLHAAIRTVFAKPDARRGATARDRVNKQKRRTKEF